MVFQKTYIKRTVAGFLLLIFALSITPTIVFHNWFSDHTDTQRKKINDCKTEQVGKQTFNCHCDNIVAESPFTGTAITAISPAPRVFNLFKTAKLVLYFSSPVVQHDLRGPPAV